MRSADRLFHVVQLIRGRSLTTAAWLSERLEVSERTVYRDVACLQSQGVPIEGEAGVGYRLGKGFEMPPLMFTADEARAMVAAVRIAQQWLDPALAQASESALGRVLSAMPTHLREQARAVGVIAPPMQVSQSQRDQQAMLGILREAASSRNKVQVTYRDAAELRSQRVLRPLACFYWGQVWTLAAWCESRLAFRNFRIDRIEELQRLDAVFDPDPGTTLADLLLLDAQACRSAATP